MNTVTLGQRLIQYRQERFLSQRQLATMAGLSHATIQRIERGTQSPSLTVVQHIAQALGVHMCELCPPYEGAA